MVNREIITQKDVLKKYVKYVQGQSLENMVIRSFMKEPMKDLDSNGKLRKHLGTLFGFNDLNLLDGLPFSHVAQCCETQNFVNRVYVPQNREQFYKIRGVLNELTNQALAHTRAFFHRNYGLRPYPMQTNVVNNEVKFSQRTCFFLVPTSPAFVEAFRNHPNYSKGNLELMLSRVKDLDRNVKIYEDKLVTFREELKETKKSLVAEIKTF